MHKYRSKFEERVAKDLTNTKVKFEYESKEIIYNKRTNRKLVCLDCGSTHVLIKAKYTPDFILENGIIIEAKGYFRSTDRSTIESVVKQYPELDIRMLFQIDGWANKSKTVKYSQWCKKRKIKYAIGKIPIEWVRESKSE